MTLSYLVSHQPSIFQLFPYTTLFRSHVLEFVRDPVQHPAPEIEVGHLPAAVHHRHLYLVAVREELARSEEHTSELQSHSELVCRLLLEKKKKKKCDIRCNVYYFILIS